MRWLGFVSLFIAAATVARSSGQTRFSSEELQRAFDNPRPTLRLPLSSGVVHNFTFTEKDFIAGELARRIRILSATSAEDSACSANVVLTRGSLSAQIFSAEGTHYLNAALGASGDFELTFSSVAGRREVGYQCLAEAGEPTPQPQGILRAQAYQNVLRRFRLAPAATAEFSSYFGSKEAAILEVVTAMTRASGIFERELGITFRLADGFEQMVFTDPATDPYSTNEPTITLINEAQAAFDTYIGSTNYDVGILLTRGQYGLAYFNSVCDPARKGASCIGLPEPAGDAFHVNLVTHELGHQFGARHTFNSPNGLCAERRDGFTSFEPGAGSSIMSYSSLPCDGDSFQLNHDAYFHSESLKQILDFVNSPPASCAEILPRDNTAPDVNAGPEYIIPTGTPFALTATASDPEGDTIFYSWEQRDLGPARSLAAPDDGLGPLFRVLLPTTNATRLFPRLERILAGTDAPEERLPTQPRTMRFRVVARDSHHDGAVSWSDTQLQVIDTGAPFQITSHNTNQTLTNSTLLEWDVAHTTNAPINASHVRITLSTNGGLDFPIVLLESTPNDGSEELVIPQIDSTAARIKIQPTNNIFFDINDAPLSISPPPVPGVKLMGVLADKSTFRISWNTLVGSNYVLQTASTLPTNRWVEVLSTNASGASVTVDRTPRASSAFYRVIGPAD